MKAMTTRAKPLVVMLPWVLFVLVIAAWAAAFLYDRDSYEVTSSLDKAWALSFLAFPVVGMFLARRIPSNPVGWLFIVGPMLVGAGVAFDELSEARGLPGLSSISDLLLTAGLLALVASILLFPDGRYPNRWWLYAHLIGILGLSAGFFVDSDAVLALNLSLPILAMIYRLVRGGPMVRRQIAGVLLVALLGVGFIAVVTSLLPQDLDTTVPATLFTMILTVGIPVSIAVAITRYRLYEIDRIISRSVGYVLVVGLLAAVFFGVVTAASSLLPTESDLAIAASTLAVAGLFNPVRRRVQVWVDRRFNRSRYDAQRVMDLFAGSLRDEVDPDRVIDGWVSVVSETMQPVSAGIWVRNDFGTMDG